MPFTLKVTPVITLTFTRRDWIAGACGLLFGLSPALAPTASGPEVIKTALACCVIAPLIVSLIAKRLPMVLGVFTNAVLAVTASLLHLRVAGDAPTASGFLLGTFLFACFLAAPAFVVSGIVKLVRHLRGNLEDEVT